MHNPIDRDSIVAAARHLEGKHWLNGRLVAPQNGQLFPVINPATRQPVLQAAAGDSADVTTAVAAAKDAQRDWAARSARERGRLVAAVGQKLAEHAEELARLMALETGKALRTECRVEANNLADVFAFFGGLGSELKGETVPFHPQMLTMTLREPVGVVGAIIPWNVPLMLAAHKVAPALVAGNSVVLKSAEEAPLAVLRAAEIAGSILPPGVWNVLSGDGPQCGAPLVAHPDIAKLSFTGSVETGRLIARIAGERLVPVTLELGGKSPMIVLADADLERAADGAVAGMRFTRQGQSCTAASRMLVQAEIFDDFLAAVTARVNRLVIGDPLAETTDIGAIISPAQFAKVQDYIRRGEVTAGATAHRCSALPDAPALRDGLFLQPVLFTGLPADHAVIREEIFGPVTALVRVRDLAEALLLANDTGFGLAGTIWTRDLRQALHAAQTLQAGFVQVNQNIVFQPGLSYGGFKQSGLGKEASLEAMLDHYTRKKTVIINLA